MEAHKNIADQEPVQENPLEKDFHGFDDSEMTGEISEKHSNKYLRLFFFLFLQIIAIVQPYLPISFRNRRSKIYPASNQ